MFRKSQGFTYRFFPTQFFSAYDIANMVPSQPITVLSRQSTFAMRATNYPMSLVVALGDLRLL